MGKKSKQDDLKRELRRSEYLVNTLRRENAALLKRALDTEKALRLQTAGFHALTVRTAFTYGEDVMDETRGKSIGKRLTLRPMETDEVLLYEVKSRRDDDGAAVIAVGLRDDPDDHKHEAELEEERAAYRAQQEQQAKEEENHE